MSVKRSATTDLNHDNWDQDDPNEHEEMGTFKAASKDVIEKRVIRTAKRRFRGSADEPKKSAFSSFGGFNKAQPSSFDFLANLTNGSKSTNGMGNNSDSANASSLFSAPASGFDSNSTKPNATQPSSLFGNANKIEIPTMSFSSSKADAGGFDLNATKPNATQPTSLFGNANKTEIHNIAFSSSKADSSGVDSNSTKPNATQPTSLFGNANKMEIPNMAFSSSKADSSGVDSNSTKPNATQPTSLFGNAHKMEIPTMTFSNSKADSTVSDSPFKMQGVTNSADSSMKSTAPVSSNVFGALATNANQNKSTLATLKPTACTTPAQNTASISVSNSKTDADKQTDVEKARNKYYSKLKGLNESVSSWIVEHVEKTPLCFLTPIFKDYENYLKEILGEYEAAKKEIETKTKEMEARPTFEFNNPPSVPAKSQDNLTPGINKASIDNTSSSAAFGTSQALSKDSPTSAAAAPAKGFSFGVTPATNPLFAAKEKPNVPSQGFSFGAKSTPASDPVSPPSKGFSFGITSTSPSSTNPAVTASNSTVSPMSKGFSFGTNPINTNSTFAPTTTAITPPSKGFSFGVAPSAASPTNNSSLFSSSTTTSPAVGLFGMPSTPASSASTAGAAPFSFGIGGAKPFSFSSQTQQNTNTDTKNEDDEDQPPKVEYTPLVEENSVFDKKCKIFVKKDGNFVDKGVSTLYIKKIEESGKHQLLVRANTSLGTILLNLILSSAVPTQRMGKNNVMLVCIPTPDAKPPPTPVLIRVKTSEEADDVLEILNKYKS